MSSRTFTSTLRALKVQGYCYVHMGPSYYNVEIDRYLKEALPSHLQKSVRVRRITEVGVAVHPARGGAAVATLTTVPVQVMPDGCMVPVGTEHLH